MAYKINWTQFIIKNPDSQKSFEELCYILFCRKYHINEGNKRTRNQVGLETDPIHVDGEGIIGFQAKFFENKLSDSNSHKQIIDSITKAKKAYPKLNKIIIYTHWQLSSYNKPKYIKKIEKNSGKVKIEWYVQSNFEITLNQPENLNLAQLFFGFGDEFGFLKSGLDHKKHTLIKSAEYQELSFIDKQNQIETNLIDSILNSAEQLFLIVGNPGSGKSIFMHKLLIEYGGLNKIDIKNMLETINKNKALPMLINLKDCYADSLENIINNRQHNYNLKKIDEFGYIYIFDGLDELNDENVENVLSYIKKICNDIKTKKIIISCRAGNVNRAKAKSLWFLFISCG